MVMVDWFSKIIRFKITNTTVSSKEITKIYWDKIWKLYKGPQKILNDREPQFTLKFMEDWMKVLDTKRTLSTVYHPQTNSQTEWINQKVKVFLRYCVNY